MGMFSAALCQGFEHCSKFEMFLTNLKIVISDVFKPGFFVEIYCSLVAVKHGKPDLPETQFLGFFQESICLLYTSPSPRDGLLSRMPSSA